MMSFFWTYYLVTVFYCIFQLIKRWRKDMTAGGLGATPALDTIMILFLAPFLAPVDFFLTWMRLYKEAEEARRRNFLN